MDREPPSFKIGNRVYLRKKQPENGISNGDLDTEMFVLSMTDHYPHIENEATGKNKVMQCQGCST